MEYCPLCGNVVDDKKDAQRLPDHFNVYPNVLKKQRKIAGVVNLITFLWVATTIICVFINSKVFYIFVIFTKFIIQEFDKAINFISNIRFGCFA